MSNDLPASARRVQQVLDAAGLAVAIVELPQSTRTAADAAASIGCRVEQIAKSLVFRRKDSGEGVLVIASGSNRVDERLVAAALHTEIERADAGFVRSTTGFAIGGIPPIGHDSPLVTLIDEDLLRLDVIWAAGGTPHAVFPLSPGELVRITSGQVMRVAEHRST